MNLLFDNTFYISFESNYQIIFNGAVSSMQNCLVEVSVMIVHDKHMQHYYSFTSIIMIFNSCNFVKTRIRYYINAYSYHTVCMWRKFFFVADGYVFQGCDIFNEELRVQLRNLFIIEG